MRILLINPPCSPQTMGLRHISRLEPLALESVGAAVSDAHDVRIVDMLSRPGDLARTLKRFRPDIAGVTAEAVRSRPAIEALRAVKCVAPDCLTVAGGNHPTLFPETFCDPAVDLCVLGEGVATFAEICAARQDGATNFEHIAGLAIRTDGGMAPTDPRDRPTTLDDQPLPDRSLTARYRRGYYYITEPSAAAMRLSYGCRHNCSFCPCPVYSGNRYVGRDPNRVYEELGCIDEPFVYFADNGAFEDVDRMQRLGEMIVSNGLAKRYLSYVRADTIVRHEDLFALWARAGLRYAMVGLEALDDSALDGYDKGTSASINEQAVGILKSLGVSVVAGFVLRDDAADEDFRRLDRYIRAHPSIVHAEFTPLTPFPGTRFHEQQRDKVITDDWDVYDMQHFVTRTDLPPKQLYRMMVRSYTKIVTRVIRREKLYLPSWGKRKLRLLRGLLANRAAFRRAHRHIAEA